MKLLTLYALLALGLLVDGAYFFRLCVICALIHEAGHAITYTLFAKKMPKLSISAGGICMQRTKMLPRTQHIIVLVAGPLTNLFFATALYFKAQISASYGVYFFAAVNVCTAVYNLLPFGALDGEQILENLISSKHITLWHFFQKNVLIALAVLMPVIAMYFNFPTASKLACVIAPLYLLLQNTFN